MVSQHRFGGIFRQFEFQPAPLWRNPAMRLRLSAFVLSLLALASSVTLVQAVCIDPLGGFAIFQCAELAYFNPVPDPNFVLQFADPNQPNTPTNIQVVFWQIGFGNQTLNTGLGSSGTGNSSASTFNGNDSGRRSIELRKLTSVLGAGAGPAGAVCIGVVHWGDQGIDGCPDNPRTTDLQASDDDILNPYYDVYLLQQDRLNKQGTYSLDWQQDYPMAVLLKTPDQRYFAYAAVATATRNNDGTGHNG